MVEFILIVYSIVLIFSIGNLIRLKKFSKFLRAEIEIVSKARLSGRYDIQWPDILASYRNLKWYDIFNYDFKNLMVYDRSIQTS